jgi:hypothetical protein
MGDRLEEPERHDGDGDYDGGKSASLGTNRIHEAS